MLKLGHATFVLAITGAAACASVTDSGDARMPRRILFIGNSLTDANNLPATVRALVDSAGFPALTIGTELVDGTNLADHWNGDGPAAIDQGWDIVVLQQGPTSTASGRAELRLMAARFAKRIRAAGGEPALLMVWPSTSSVDDYPAVSRSYRLAAEDVNGFLYPAGEAWLETWRRNIAMPLYSDGLHPSPYGTYATALTIVGVTYRRSVIGLPATLNAGGTGIYINPVDARVIQQSVDEAVRQHGRRPR
jgi:hypothetical protein